MVGSVPSARGRHPFFWRSLPCFWSSFLRSLSWQSVGTVWHSGYRRRGWNSGAGRRAEEGSGRGNTFPWDVPSGRPGRSRASQSLSQSLAGQGRDPGAHHHPKGAPPQDAPPTACFLRPVPAPRGPLRPPLFSTPELSLAFQALLEACELPGKGAPRRRHREQEEEEKAGQALMLQAALELEGPVLPSPGGLRDDPATPVRLPEDASPCCSGTPLVGRAPGERSGALKNGVLSGARRGRSDPVVPTGDWARLPVSSPGAGLLVGMREQAGLAPLRAKSVSPAVPNRTPLAPIPLGLAAPTT